MAVNLTNGVSIGWETKVSIDKYSAGSAIGAPKIICCDKIIPRHTVELVRNSEGAMCGDPDLPNWRTQKGRQFLRGSLIFYITGSVIDFLMPILGLREITTGVTATYELGINDVLVEWDMDIDLAGSVHQLTSCVCEKWAIRGSKGSKPIEMQIDYIAETESEGVFAGAVLDFEDVFAYTDLSTFTHNSVSRTSADRFLLQVDNKPIIEYGASTTMTDAHLGPRECVIATSTPYSSTHDDLYWTAKTDETGLNTVIVLSSADRVYTFTAAKAIGIPALGPVTSRADQIRTPVTLLAHRIDTGPGTRVSPLTLGMANPV